MFATNAASVGVAAKLGLQPLPASEEAPEGCLRYEVTREEWEARLTSAPAGP